MEINGCPEGTKGKTFKIYFEQWKSQVLLITMRHCSSNINIINIILSDNAN